MAVISPVERTIKKNVRMLTWTGTNADTYVPYKLSGNAIADISVQFAGGGGTLAGSNQPDGSLPATLRDLKGTNLSLLAGDLEGTLERPLWIVPTVTGVGATTVTVVIWR